jgi:hypothetical protein
MHIHLQPLLNRSRLARRRPRYDQGKRFIPVLVAEGWAISAVNSGSAPPDVPMNKPLSAS